MTDKPRHLLLGCGTRRDKFFGVPEWGELVTVDNEFRHKPDLLFDLEKVGSRYAFFVRDDWEAPLIAEPFHDSDLSVGARHGFRRFGYSTRLPFPEDTFDEVHAYEVLEHVGAQGDAKLFLDQFSDFWRVLKPGGMFFATVPDYLSMWAWGDPSHKRIITEGTLVFLNQPAYTQQVDGALSPMSDFRSFYKADFDIIHKKVESGQFQFGLRAVKPSRCTVAL